jgi:hypothetical protein
VNGSVTDSGLKTRRLIVRGGLLLVYGTLIGLSLVLGKGHTVLLDNKDSEDGSVKAIESLTVSVDGQDSMEFMAGDRDITKVRSQWHTLVVDMNGQKTEKKFKVPLGEDMVLLSIPKLLAGVEPAVIPFVPRDEPAPAGEPTGNDNQFTSPGGTPESPDAPAAAPAAP